MAEGWVDYWCNAFTPEQAELWDQAIAAQGIPLKVRRDQSDSFTDVASMIARMDEIGVDTLVLPCADTPAHAGPTDYELFTPNEPEILKWAEEYPGRFVGLASIDPCLGQAGVRRARELLEHSCFIGIQTHTHSWDRPFDHRDYYPYYALAADLDVPMLMQAGTSGGRMASQCGQPIGIDRPAMYFPEVRFVLSHTGWPWVEEAIAMALKFSNVFLGTAAYPPHHWGESLLGFIRGPGRGKVMLGTSFPTVGHRHALKKLEAVDLSSEARSQLLNGAAMRVFGRLASQNRQ